MTEEEYQAAMDKMWPRMVEPDEEGIDLHPGDPRRRFIAVAEGTIFTQADPITDEEREKVNRMWEMMTGEKPEKKKIFVTKKQKESLYEKIKEIDRKAEKVEKMTKKKIEEITDEERRKLALEESNKAKKKFEEAKKRLMDSVEFIEIEDEETKRK